MGGLVSFFVCGPFSSLLQSEYLVGRAWFEERRPKGLGFWVRGFRLYRVWGFRVYRVWGFRLYRV